MLQITEKSPIGAIRAALEERPVQAFIALTFAFSWSIWIATGVIAPDRLPLAVLPGAWGPTFVAFILTAITRGKAGVRELLGKILRWRVGLLWYLVALIGIAVIAFSAVGIYTLFRGTFISPQLPEGMAGIPIVIYLPIAFIVNLLVGGPIAEEFGWRGFAQPRLQSRIGVFKASLLIGIVWGLWHLPLFIFGDGTAVGSIPFPAFILLTTAWSVLLAWVYNGTGSMLMPVLMHASFNTWLNASGLFQVGSMTPELLALFLALVWTAAIGVTVFFGKSEYLVSGIFTEWDRA